MQRVAAQSGIVFLELELLRFRLLVARRRITGRRLAFLARLRAFDGDDFSRHKLFFLFGLVIGFLAGLFGVGGGFLLTPLLHTALPVSTEVWPA